MSYVQDVLHAQQGTTDTHRQARNTFSLIRLILHVFKTDILEHLCTSTGGGENPKLHNLVGNTGQSEKKIHQVSDLWTFGTILIAHAAFLDSGSFCKTK